jgi:hypothetical protein
VGVLKKRVSKKRVSNRGTFRKTSARTLPYLLDTRNSVVPRRASASLIKPLMIIALVRDDAT